MSPARMAKIESAIRIALEFNEAFNRGDITGVINLISEDCAFENASPAPDGAAYLGKDAVAQFLRDFFRDSPQARIEIEEVFGLGRRCIMRWKYHWTDETGQACYVRGVDIFKVEEGLISEKFSYLKG